MAENLVKVVLDTNIIVSSFIFGGKPESIFRLVAKKYITAVTSPNLLSELTETFTKKFQFPPRRIKTIENQIKKYFRITYPTKTIDAVRDNSDNKVLEAAVEGNCDFIITGDKDLLYLKGYKNIKIVGPDEFLHHFLKETPVF